jgi:heterotetrameric sarcosine oxidase gamma subunit
MGEPMNLTFASRHALTDSTVHGIEMPGANHLELIEGARIHSVLAFKHSAEAVADALGQLLSGSVRRVGPGEWLVVSTDPEASLLIDGAMVVDQSHGRVLFRLSGPDSIRLLMKGVAVDLAGNGFPVGASATMAFGHLTINLMRIDDKRFEIIGMRSFAESLFHDLKLAGREVGLSFAVSER